MRADKKLRKYFRDKREGLIYTVEEVSDLLGIPRPTLYRYLREYSIPHLRRSGRISIPEESFDLIREARDLHKEGLGTELVRRSLREGGGDPGSGELKERLERLSETLEGLKANGPTTDEALPSHALRTVLARQSLIMSVMFNLTEMVEELLLASGKPRKAAFDDLEDELRERPLPLQRTGTPEEVPATVKPATGARSPVLPTDQRFGSLARRRRRGSLMLLSALLVVAVLTWTIPTLDGELASGLSLLDGQAEESSSGEDPRKAAAQSASAGNEDSGSEKAGRIEVPAVSDRGVVEAARLLSGAGFEVAAIKIVASQEEAGTVMRTKPSAGSAVEPGAPVVLVMSGGPTGIPPGVGSGGPGGGAVADQYGN